MSGNDYMQILLSPVGRDGCSFNRITQPYKTIQAEDLAAIKFIDQKWSGEESMQYIIAADVLVIRPGQEALWQFVKKNRDIIKAKVVIDLDDDLWDITPFAQTYAHHGTEEVEYDGEMLWKDGESNFDIARNKKWLENLITTIQEVDIVTVSTDRLKKRIMERTGAKNVIVVHNHIDFTHWNKLPLKKNKVFKIGWTGGSTHYIDWYTIKDVLPQVVTEGSKLVLQGCKWDGTIKGLNYEFHDWIDNEGHPYKIASYGLDMAIIPLKDTEFNKYKSCLKWYEFSALEVPCVLANVPPYSDEVEHGVTGFLYNTPEEFVKYANMLKNDEKLRKKIGKNARKWVEKNRDSKNIAKKLYEELERQAR